MDDTQERLKKLRGFLDSLGESYTYREEDGCGSLDWIHRGLSYHVWEYPDSGAQSNVRSAGRQEDFGPDYEEEILEILRSWQQ